MNITIRKKYKWNPLTLISNITISAIGLFELYLLIEYIKIILTNIN